MSWSVRLQDERGRPVILEDADIDFSMIPQETRFKLLHYIDPYGHTYFNQVQMKDFLADWNELHPANEHQRTEWALVKEMATRCHDEVHLYLHFTGD